jgi:uncharacterized membrane protein
MSDLIVIGYPGEETAEKVWNELVSLQEDFLVDLEDAAIIRRDQKGRLHVTTPAHHAVTWGTLSGLFWGVLIGLNFLWPRQDRAVVHHLARAALTKAPEGYQHFDARDRGLTEVVLAPAG